MGSIGPSTTQHHGDLTTSRSSTPDSQATVTERPESEASEKDTPEHQASDSIDSRTTTEIYHTAAYIRHQIDELHPADQDMVHEYQASESHRVYAAYDIGNDAEGTSYIPSPLDEYFHYNGLCRLPRRIDYLAFSRGTAYPGAAIGHTRERGYHREDYEFYAVAPEHFRHLTRCTHAYNAIVEEMENQRRQSVGLVGRPLWIPNLQGQREGLGERHGQPQGQYQNQWQYLQHQQHQHQHQHQHHQQQKQQQNHRQQQQQTPHHASRISQQPVPAPQPPLVPPKQLSAIPQRPPRLQQPPVRRPYPPPQPPQPHPPQLPQPHPQPQPQPHLQAPALLPAAQLPQVSHLPLQAPQAPNIPPQLPHLGPWHGMTRSEKKRAKNKKKRQAQAARKRAQYASSPSLSARQGKRYSATHWPDADVWAEEIEGYEGVVLEEYGDGNGEGDGEDGDREGEVEAQGQFKAKESNKADGVEQELRAGAQRQPQQEPQQEPHAGTKTDPNPKHPTIAQYQAALLDTKASLSLMRDGEDWAGVGMGFESAAAGCACGD